MPASRLASAPGWRVCLLVLAGLASLAAFTTAAAAADSISVVVDRAKVLRISQPADVVVIGNPAIADATIQDSRTLILTGRSYGTTNLIVLDKQGQQIASELVTVVPSDNEVVTIYRRDKRQTLSCTPDCSPVMTMGDDPTEFNAVNTQIQAARALAQSANH